MPGLPAGGSVMWRSTLCALSVTLPGSEVPGEAWDVTDHARHEGKILDVGMINFLHSALLWMHSSVCYLALRRWTAEIFHLGSS